MSKPTGRLLAVLSALQSRPSWPGPELAERVGVTVRTVRRDVERLRSLGYVVDSTPGAIGGYSLGPGGTALPPLMLDTDEAVAVALCIRAAASDSVAGVREAAEHALAKLEQTLPRHARTEVAAVTQATVRIDADEPDQVDPSILVALSRACRERSIAVVRYRNRHGDESERRLEPYRVVNLGRRWYLVARDVGGEWRTFRIDRVMDAVTTGHRFELDDPPDAEALVRTATGIAPYRYRARIEFDAPVDAVTPLVPAAAGVVEMIDERISVLVAGGDDLEWMAFHLAMMKLPFRVLDPPDLAEACRTLAGRLLTAADRRPPA